jgi:hypothetical protein
MDQFVKSVNKLLDDYGYESRLCNNIIMPIACTNGEDPPKLILDTLEWNLQYGSMDYCDINNGWVPYVLVYNWCKKVTIIMVNLMTKRFAKKIIGSATDYTPAFEYDIEYLTHLDNLEPFILPSRVYEFGGGDYPVPEALIPGVKLKESDNEIELDVDGNRFIYNKTTRFLLYNGKFISEDSDDEECQFITIVEAHLGIELHVELSVPLINEKE